METNREEKISCSSEPLHLTGSKEMYKRIQAANMPRKPKRNPVHTINDAPTKDFLHKEKKEVWKIWQNKWERN